jgi:Domain of unknown function (DUF4157)
MNSQQTFQTAKAHSSWVPACPNQAAQPLQRSSVNAGAGTRVPPSVHETLRSPGQPLDVAIRSFMEPRFGRDFSSVRVHSDSQAVESARGVNANAYAVGNHIVFGAGKYAPDQNEGKHLIAHELVHTIQTGAESSAEVHTIGTQDSAEKEADRVANSVLKQGTVRDEIVHSNQETALRRQPIYPQDADKSLDPKTPPLLVWFPIRNKDLIGRSS